MTPTTQAHVTAPATIGMDAERAAREVANYWWLGVVTGTAWCVAALVILQFDATSAKTVGVIIGFMFIAAGMQKFAIAALDEQLRWLWAAFGVLFVLCGIAALANPEDTFAGVADMLGFLFLVVALSWIVEAFLGTVRWLRLTAGILMLALAFWTSGQFFIDKAYALLVFAGIWALLHGITDIVAAFTVRASFRDEPAARS